MTPKEKALELIDKMNNVDLNCDNESMCMLYPHAIECTIIAVDELIKSWDKDLYENCGSSEYWNEVKNEILTIKNN